MDPLERAKMVKKFGEDRSSSPGLAESTNAVRAMDDENRELGWAIDAVGDNKSPGSAEAADLNAKSGALLAKGRRRLPT